MSYFFFAVFSIIKIVYNLALKNSLLVLKKTFIFFYLSIFWSFYITITLILLVFNLDLSVKNMILICCFFVYLIIFFFISIIIFPENDIAALKIFIYSIFFAKFIKFSKTSSDANW